MPEIDVVAEIRRHVEIEQPVAVVVEPDRSVAVHPAPETGGLGHVLEMRAVDILEERQIAVAIDEEILAAVVVDVAPDGAHRNTLARTVEVGHAGARGDVLEGAVAPVVVERVGIAEAAVREVEVGLSVAVEVGDGYASAESGDVRLDAGDARVEAGAVMDEVDSRLGGLVSERESGMRRIRA